MTDPCEIWESIPGLKLIVWESHDMMHLPNCFACRLRYICLITTDRFRCVIVFVGAKRFNVEISPTFYERYISA